jgi:hypothetical protein
MLVGNNKLATIKNAGESLAILIFWPRLPIPAGILRIPFFSVPVARFEQES